MLTCMITMSTLTSDKLTSIKAGFPMKNLVHQGPGGPHQSGLLVLGAYTGPQNVMMPIRRLCALSYLP
jgi:hypothetical protein